MSIKETQKNIFPKMKEKFHYKNVMQMPRLIKIVVSSGTGKIKDKKKLALIEDRLTQITGQKVKTTTAKKSIASFKVRAGDSVGFQVTLRGDRMFSFFDKLIHIAFPRTKDFRGIKKTAIDNMGNLSVGIKEHTIFPETSDEDVKDVFSFAITIVTSAKTKEEAFEFLKLLGFPFQQIEDSKKK